MSDHRSPGKRDGTESLSSQWCREVVHSECWVDREEAQRRWQSFHFGGCGGPRSRSAPLPERSHNTATQPRHHSQQQISSCHLLSSHSISLVFCWASDPSLPCALSCLLLAPAAASLSPSLPSFSSGWMTVSVGHCTV